MNSHFDIVVVGAGPAGLHAARAAAREGASVALLDDNPRAGGQIWRQGPGHPPQAPLQALLATLGEQHRLTYWPSTRVVAPLDRPLDAPLASRGLLLESAERGGVSITYDRLILATGARELLLPFTGWTLPGVTGAGALQALIKGGMPVRGERVVIAGSGPLLIAALASAHAAGARVVAVVEQASALDVARFTASLLVEPAKLRQAIGMGLSSGLASWRYWTGSVVKAAYGNGRVEQVTIRRGERDVTLDCERVACGYGLVPNSTLAQALGCAIGDAGEIMVDDAQRTSVHSVLAAGECTGVGGAERAAVEGEIAGLVASGTRTDDAADGATGSAPGVLVARRARWRRFAHRVATAFALQEAARTPPDDATLLCRCEDVSLGEVRACRDGREAKLHTRCAMGACQGRICGAAASVYFGWPAATPRPPFSPAAIRTLMLVDDEASSD
ncbi:FAD-dependent oxidoreductase [Paraburkholderia sp. PREW-6R]|uniref:FAD-dependent oxidoreductase n=1 Tax=Paraburkholderia sp. PREW-6R TaxID=3141544 RepID=UPI0031F4B842